MGGKTSKEDSFRQNSYGSRSSASSSSWSGYPPVQPPYPPVQPPYPPPQYSYPPQPEQESQGYYAPEQQEYPSSLYSRPPPQQEYGGKRKLDRRYSRIADNYSSLEQVYDLL